MNLVLIDGYDRRWLAPNTLAVLRPKGDRIATAVKNTETEWWDWQMVHSELGGSESTFVDAYNAIVYHHKAQTTEEKPPKKKTSHGGVAFSKSVLSVLSFTEQPNRLLYYDQTRLVGTIVLTLSGGFEWSLQAESVTGRSPSKGQAEIDMILAYEASQSSDELKELDSQVEEARAAGIRNRELVKLQADYIAALKKALKAQSE